MRRGRREEQGLTQTAQHAPDATTRGRAAAAPRRRANHAGQDSNPFAKADGDPIPGPLRFGALPVWAWRAHLHPLPINTAAAAYLLLFRVILSSSLHLLLLLLFLHHCHGRLYRFSAGEARRPHSQSHLWRRAVRLGIHRHDGRFKSGFRRLRRAEQQGRGGERDQSGLERVATG